MYRDIFNLIAVHFDGRDASRCRAVSRTWKRWVDDNALLSWKRRVHLVILNDIDQLETTISNGDTLTSISLEEADMWVENILWFNYRENVHAFECEEALEFPKDRISINFVNCFLLDHAKSPYSVGGEGASGFLQNQITKEMIYVDNYYGCFTAKCRSGDRNSVIHECTPADHFLERLQFFSQRFPGLVSNWKMVHFPRQPHCRHELFETETLRGQTFHRGTSMMLTLHPGSIRDAFPITSNLKRMVHAMPNQIGQVGRGKKRRVVRHEVPDHWKLELPPIVHHGLSTERYIQRLPGYW